MVTVDVWIDDNSSVGRGSCVSESKEGAMTLRTGKYRRLRRGAEDSARVACSRASGIDRCKGEVRAPMRPVAARNIDRGPEQPLTEPSREAACRKAWLMTTRWDV